MIRPQLQRPAFASVLIFLLSLASGCGEEAPGPHWCLRTGAGDALWDTLDTSGLLEENYLDQGVEKPCLALYADSGARLNLSSPALPVSAGASVAFSFALERDGAGGQMFEARLELYDQSDSLLADSLLFSSLTREREPGAGLSRRWTEYTRSLKVPAGAAKARLRLTSAPSQGVVRLGRTAFLEGEGWLGEAATFSSWLGRNPAERYGFTAGRYIEPQGAPQPSAVESGTGLIVFERKGLVDAWPYSLPRPDDIRPAFQETVPRATTAPFAFGVRALEDLSSVEISLGRPFSGEHGELHTRPRLYQARFAATRLEGSWSREFGPRARLLERPRLKPLPAGEARFFWIDVPVPENAAPGVYESAVLLKAPGHAALSVPLRIEVLPVTVPALWPDSLPKVGFYYYPPLDNPQQMELQLRDMAAHGFTSLSLGGAFVTRTGEYYLALDLARVRQLHTLFMLMRRCGFDHPTPFYVADLPKRLNLPESAGKWSEQDKLLYARAVRMMDDTAHNWGWPQLLFFPVDEPSNEPERMALARLTLGILRGMNGVRTLCDLNSPSSIQELSQYLDAVVMQISSVSPQTLDFVRQNKAAPYFYLPCFGSSDMGADAVCHRVIPGWFLPRTGACGIYYFAYQAVTGDPYDELDGAQRDWCAAYPGQEAEELCPSPEYQGIRRGIEDLHLVLLARSLAAACRAGQNPTAVQAADSAVQSLERIMSQIAPDGDGVMRQLRVSPDPYLAEAWRQELLQGIMAMQRALGR
ncbi:hypothetical protein LLH00_05665 [bacterium]|nr:hypothetical protein [bacterium]